MKTTISVQCFTKADATMYLQVLQEAGYAAQSQAYSDPRIINIAIPVVDGQRLDPEEFTTTVFDLYSQRVAN